MKTCLVVPSIRPDSFREFVAAWDGPQGDWDEAILVQEFAEGTRGPLPANWRSFGVPDIEATLGDDAWIISRKDSAIRCFGTLMAWRAGADVILHLDDDVRPIGGDGICAGHVAAMDGHCRWVSSVPGMRVRGLPYRNLGRLGNVVASMGLWSDVPDLDAVATLSGIYPTTGFEPPNGVTVIPNGQYMPTCGMNLAFRREFAPLAYFPPMGQDRPYARFDDIWFGIIAKKICDHLGWHISAGEPHVRHVRASDPFANLRKETPGIIANETFWEIADSAGLAGDNPLHCVYQMGIHMKRHKDPYIAKLGEALRVWGSFFK